MAATKKPAKLPASLKVDVYANVVAASAELIVAGCDSAGKLAAWSTGGGAAVIDKPFQPGLEYRTGPAKAGLAALPGGRFVMASRTVNDGGTVHPSMVGVFGLDGALLGKGWTEGKHAFDACAASRAGDLVAVASSAGDDAKLSLWRTEDLIAGKKPLHTFPGLWPGALTFTADGASVVFFSAGKLYVVPTAGGAVAEKPVKASVETAGVISVSDDGLVCASDESSASVMTLTGKRVLDWPAPSFSSKRSLAVEQAMVTAGGEVIAVAGAIGKHYARDFAAGVKFPEPAMAEGFVAVFDAKGALLRWAPRAKNKPVRAMALAPGRAVVIGQDGAAELAPWPLG